MTLLVDSSASMSALDSGKSRNIWLQDALKAVVTGNPTASIGRWTVSTADGD